MRYLVLPLCLFAFLSLHAQNYTQRIQQTRQGEGTVTIHQDAAIDQLVNGAPLTAPPAPVAKKDDKPQGGTTQKQPQQPTVQPPAPADTSVVSAPRRTYRTTGYRVQVFAGDNSRPAKQKAEQIGRSMEALFPGETVYVHFYSPRWVCRIGNYLTIEEANERLKEVRELGYKSAILVKGKIVATQ